MKPDYINGRDFTFEFNFAASRSSGPGGQNVNKVSTKIELRFDVNSSQLLSDGEKVLVNAKLANKISNEGILIIVAQTDRSQLKNKEDAIKKFYILIEKAIAPVKKRKPTKPSKAAKEKRLVKKRIIAEKKVLRKGVEQ
jgi:ribosome-associated protein